MSLLPELRSLRRAMLRSPGQALAVWACTAVWLAVAPAVLSLLGTLRWKSLPFPAAERIVQINAGLDLTPALAGSEPFQAAAAYDAGWLVVESPRRVESVLGAAVDAAFFEVLASRPIRGRVFTPGSMAADAGGVVVTERLSRRLFGGTDPVGRAVLRVSGRPFAVAAVIPDRPVFPPRAELWALRASGLRPDGGFLPPGVPRLGILGRLAPGADVRAADAAARRAAQDFERRENVRQGDVEAVSLATLLRRRSGGEHAILVISLAGLLGFVLLAYVSALAGFALARQGEMAVRAALGAPRLALVRLLLLELALLAVPGAVAGLPLASPLLRRLSGLIPPSLAELIPPRLDPSSLALAGLGWLAVALASALAVWLSAPRIGLASRLAPDRSEATPTRPRARLRLAFVTAALSLAVALGIGAATLRRSLALLEQVPLGFEPRGMASAVLRFARPPAAEASPAALARLLDGLRGVPGVAAVSLSDAIPFAAPAGYLEISDPERSAFRLARIQGIHGDYLRAAGLRLVAGRGFTAPEEQTGAAVALLDAGGARSVFDGAPALGRPIRVNGRSVEIVGLVAAAKGAAIDEPQRPQLYLPLRFRHAVEGPGDLAVLLRLSRPVGEAELNAAVARAGAAVSQLRPLSDLVAASLAPRRLARDLVSLLWLAALALVALASFGTFSWLLEMQALELAVRLALGDSPAGIARRALRGVLFILATAILLGVALYLPLGQGLRVLLFRVEPLNPQGLLAAILAVGGAALGAAALAIRSGLRRASLDLLHGRGAET